MLDTISNVDPKTNCETVIYLSQFEFSLDIFLKRLYYILGAMVSSTYNRFHAVSRRIVTMLSCTLKTLEYSMPKDIQKFSKINSRTRINLSQIYRAFYYA